MYVCFIDNLNLLACLLWEWWYIFFPFNNWNLYKRNVSIPCFRYLGSP